MNGFPVTNGMTRSPGFSSDDPCRNRLEESTPHPAGRRRDSSQATHTHSEAANTPSEARGQRSQGETREAPSDPHSGCEDDFPRGIRQKDLKSKQSKTGLSPERAKRLVAEREG